MLSVIQMEQLFKSKPTHGIDFSTFGDHFLGMNTRQYSVTSALIWNCFNALQCICLKLLLLANMSYLNHTLLLGWQPFNSFGLFFPLLFLFLFRFSVWMLCSIETLDWKKTIYIYICIYALSTTNHVYLKGFLFNLKPEFDWCAKKGNAQQCLF